MSLHHSLHKFQRRPRPNSRGNRHGGFIGAGTILAEQEKVVGITTAASLWVTAAIGLTIGIGDYPLAVTVTVLVVIILFSKFILKKLSIE